MKNQIKQKKAEISVSFLITIIILIVSFAIILFLWYQFFWSSNIDRETCHTSVILKKTVPDSAVLGSKIVDLPLRCKTERICLTSGGNDAGCNNIGSKYQKISVSSEEDIIKNMAENMVSCWGMMGESRDAAVFSKELQIKDSSKAVICSIIDLSPSVRSKFKIISSSKFNDYLAKTKIPEGTQTYAQYLSNSDHPTSASGKMDVDLAANKPVTIIFVEFRRGTVAKLLGTGGAALFAGALFVAAAPVIGVGAAVVGGLVAAGGSAYATAGGLDKWEAFLSDNKADFYSAIVLRYWDIKELQDLKIDTFENLI